MDIIRDILTLVLDLVGDTRRYACVSRLAAAQCSARPDHAVWQRIRSLNDQFTIGNKSTLAWALTNIKELASLDEDGFVCALANAVRADNVEVVSALIPRVMQLERAASYCSEKTYMLFNIDWKLVPLSHCRCPHEIGYHFGNIPTALCNQVIGNTMLSDEYLIKMLHPDAHPYQLLEHAIHYNRIQFALAVVDQFGTEYILQAVYTYDFCGHFRLAKILLAMSPDVDNDFVLERTRCSAIRNGLIDEFDKNTADHLAAENIKKGVVIHADGYISNISTLEYMAEHWSDEKIEKYQSGTLTINATKLAEALCRRGRVGFSCVGELPSKCFIFHRTSLDWAIARGMHFDKSVFVETTVDLYLAARFFKI